MKNRAIAEGVLTGLKVVEGARRCARVPSSMAAASATAKVVAETVELLSRCSAARSRRLLRLPASTIAYVGALDGIRGREVGEEQAHELAVAEGAGAISQEGVDRAFGTGAVRIAHDVI